MRSVRAALVPVLLAPLALTGCGPALEGAVAVTVRDGRVFLLVVTCDATVVQTRVSTFARHRSSTVALSSATVPQSTAALLPIDLLVADVAPRLAYSVDPVDDDSGVEVFGAHFRRDQLTGLSQDEVVVDVPLGPEYDPGQELGHRTVVDRDEFVDGAC
jgi:hypothetical protein